MKKLKLMKKIHLTFLTLLLALPFTGKAQENKVKVKFSGFVKTDVFWDSRQTVGAREGQFLLWPSKPVYDSNNEDINANSNFNMLSIQSRLSAGFTGPDVLGARTSAKIEGAFFGSTEGGMNGLRLRHAFVQLDWTKTSLLVGQTWHPMFPGECFPGTVSFNTGVPFITFSRNPQVRFTYHLGNFNLVAAALSERDFTSKGPDKSGNMVGNSSFLRDASIPEFDLGFDYASKNLYPAIKAGAHVNYKQILPRKSYTHENKEYTTNERLNSMSAMAYARFTFKPMTIKFQGTKGQNTSSFLMLGGYGEHMEENGSYTYSPINITSVWTDIQTNGKTWQGGLFMGYTQNEGSDDQISKIYGNGADIEYVYRISPRVVYNIKNFRIAFETEYTVAAYGEVNGYGKPVNSKEVGNLRLLGGVFYFF